MNGWIGVDLDGTLAYYDEWRGPEHIGEPIPLMVERVKTWLDQGIEVRVMTARVCREIPYSQRARAEGFIHDWCLKHIGRILPVTHEKDFSMIALWDDRAVTVEQNTGRDMRMVD